MTTTDTTNLTTTESGDVRLYTRETIKILPKTSDRSLTYSRSVAREIFNRYSHVRYVEYVASGYKTHSAFVGERGVYNPPEEVFVYVASTGGRYGRSSRSYYSSPTVTVEDINSLCYFVLASEALPEGKRFSGGSRPKVGASYSVTRDRDGRVTLEFDHKVNVSNRLPFSVKRIVSSLAPNSYGIWDYIDASTWFETANTYPIAA
jgi:hypothetical protein